MRVDFYQLTRDPVEAVLPLIARNTLAQGQRLLVVSEPDQFDRLSDALWTRLPESFLAHGRADEVHADRQPILLSTTVHPANGARYVALADGVWREEALTFDRAFLLFGDATIVAARAVWRDLGTHADLDRHLWKQDGGKWQEAG
ncbi:DNA polymerase III subunit chi [Novosphingobium sp.]|uniref:DNA polymerase III subunit chi n=1 Tax=Novosphingobium sp. TaxID=1874826 RepID=UPI0025F912BC|nr:DNA polymerase III subunit chi [Novosphingobium sp.]